MKGYLYITAVIATSMLVVSELRAASVELTSSMSKYSDYTSVSRSASLINDIGNGYSYALTMAKDVDYSVTIIDGNLKVKNTVEINQFSVSVKKMFRSGVTFITPEVGVGLSIVDLTTTARYNNDGTLQAAYAPIDISFTLRQSKSYILPFIGLSTGVYIHDNVYVFFKYKYNGYSVRGMGIGMGF